MPDIGTQKPALGQLNHFCSIVPNADRVVDLLVRFGMGPFKVNFDERESILRGQRVRTSNKLPFTPIAPEVTLVVAECLRGRGIHHDMLEQFGGGITHLAIDVPDAAFDSEIERLTKAGIELAMAPCEDKPGEVYMDMREHGGLYLEMHRECAFERRLAGVAKKEATSFAVAEQLPQDSGVKPALGQLDHLGIVVKDLDRAVNYYSKIGIGLGQYDLSSGAGRQLLLRGKKTRCDYRTASAPFAPGVTISLIQSTGESVHSEVLDAMGDGISHLAFKVRDADFEAEVDRIQRAGIPVVMVPDEAKPREVYFDTRDVARFYLALVRV